jgi:hypothetical protein
MKTLFNETSLARVARDTVGDRNPGLITAFRSDRQHDENLTLTARLFNAIQLPQWGLGLLEVKRHFVDSSKPTETLFIVFGDENDHGRLIGFLRKAGLCFGQEVFILNSQLCYVGDKRHIEEIGPYHPARMDEYFNRLIPADGFHMVERIVFLRGWTFFSFMAAHIRTGGHLVKEEY